MCEGYTAWPFAESGSQPSRLPSVCVINDFYSNSMWLSAMAWRMTYIHTHHNRTHRQTTHFRAIFKWEFCILLGSCIRYYNISSTWVDWTSMIYMISYIPLIFPASWMLDKWVRTTTATNDNDAKPTTSHCTNVLRARFFQLLTRCTHHSHARTN